MYMNYKFKLEFELTPDEYFVLLHLKKNGYGEYRDTNYHTLEDYLEDPNKHKPYEDENANKRYFLDRNVQGTYYLLNNLFKYNLIESNDNSWHYTVILTKLGDYFMSRERIKEREIQRNIDIRNSTIEEVIK